MQSFGAIRHYDLNMPAHYSYEQAIETARLLNLTHQEIEQQVRRALFNVVIRNQDDHVKNIAYLMDQRGNWKLSPAYDVVYSYNPKGDWTSKHQMTINGKSDHFSMEDFIKLGAYANIKSKAIRDMIDEIVEVAKRWGDTYAAKAEVPESLSLRAFNGYRMKFPIQ